MYNIDIINQYSNKKQKQELYSGAYRMIKGYFYFKF